MVATGAIRQICKGEKSRMEAKEDADRASIEKEIIYCLRFLDLKSLIRVMHYIRRIW